MRLVCAVVGIPDRIVSALVRIAAARTDVAAGLVRLVRERTVAVVVILPAAEEKISAAVFAFVRETILFDAGEEVVVQERLNIIESDLLAEYRCARCVC